MTSTVQLNKYLLETMLACAGVLGQSQAAVVQFSLCSAVSGSLENTTAANTVQVVSGLKPYFLQRIIDSPSAGDVTLKTVISFHYTSETPATCTHLAAYINGKLLFFADLTAPIILDSTNQTAYLVTADFVASSL